MSLDLKQARETFDSAVDFTVGLEEEFALLDPETLSLANEFDRLVESARGDELLAESLVGELITSEIEIRSGRGADFADALARQRERRRRLFALAASERIALGAMGTHPWSPWQDQHIIDTPHYRRVAEGLQYVAWRNNSFGLQVHVGIRGAERAVAVADAMRPLLPALLAASANSAFVEGSFTRLHSVRSQIFTKSFPRCGVPDFLGSWDVYADYVNLLLRTGSIAEYTQIWWSVRPHPSFGTVEVRIMDAQSRADESTALAALATACLAQAAVDHDEGVSAEPVAGRLIEENMWRAIRHGLDGKLIELERGEEIPARGAVEDLLDWTAPARAQLDLDSHLDGLRRLLDSGNGAQHQWQRYQAGESMSQIYAAEVEETAATYSEAGTAAEVPREGVAG